MLRNAHEIYVMNSDDSDVKAPAVTTTDPTDPRLALLTDAGCRIRRETIPITRYTL